MKLNVIPSNCELYSVVGIRILISIYAVGWNSSYRTGPISVRWVYQSSRTRNISPNPINVPQIDEVAYSTYQANFGNNFCTLSYNDSVMPKSLSPRIDQDIREVIVDIAEPKRTISDAAADLIRVGIAIRATGCEPQIRGPLGLPRPFAEITLSKTTAEIRTSIDEEVHNKLTNQFDNKPNTAAREALRLGVLTVAGDQFAIEGPAGAPRPFAEIEIDPSHDIYSTVEKLQEQLD